MRKLFKMIFSLFKSKKKTQKEDDFYEGEYQIERYEREHGCGYNPNPCESCL